MKKKAEKKTAQEDAIPAGVYPELDRDLGRDRAQNAFRGIVMPGFQPGVINSGYPVGSFPLGVYPVFDSDLPRSNEENNLTADILEGAWPGPPLD